MGYPQQAQYGPPHNGQQQYPPQPPTAPAYGQDPWANGNLPTGSYDGADPFDNAIPEQRGQRAALAGPDGLPVIHTDREPVFVSPPSLRTLGVGTLIFIVPKKIERGVKSTRKDAFKPIFDRMTADVIVCDGQGRKFGGDPTRTLDDMLGPYPVPCVIEDMWIDKDSIIERVPEHLIGNGFKIGRIVKVKTSNDRMAWNFAAPHEDPAQAAAIVQSLRGIWEAYRSQRLPILSLKTLAEQYGVKPGAAAAQSQPQAGQQYGQAAVVTQQSYGPYATPGPGQYPQPVQQNQPPAWPPMQPGRNVAPMQQVGLTPAGQQVAQQAQGYPAQPVSAPVAPVQDWTLNYPAPPGWQATWPTLAPAQREQMLAQMGVTGPAAQQAAPAAMAGGPYAQGPGY